MQSCLPVWNSWSNTYYVTILEIYIIVNLGNPETVPKLPGVQVPTYGIEKKYKDIGIF